MAHEQVQGGLSERRLQRAVEYVSDYWVPANPELVKKIKVGLEWNAYDENFESLVADVRQDFSLFTFCLRRLLTMLRADGVALPENINPIQVFHQAGLARLKAILESGEREISVHSIQVGSDLQMARFREAMLSATTAETLSENYGVDSEEAYSGAFLRQLGYVLISWNYPEIYHEVVFSLKPGDMLDVELSKKLGFSPQLLSLRILHSWGISDSFCSRIGLAIDDLDANGQLKDPEGSVLAHICRVGEALARANQADHYPNARDDWEIAKNEIEKNLGPDGMKVIQEKFQDNCRSYLDLMPEIFEPGLNLSAPPEVEEPDARNPFFTLCTEKVQKALDDFYSKFSAEPVSRDNLRLLVRETIPRAGFESGCIFSIDPGVMMLMPQLEIGKTKLSMHKPVEYSVAQSKGDLVAIAFQANDIGVAYRSTKEGKKITAFAGAFGGAERVGVLYLEMPGVISNDPHGQEINHVKALVVALNHCLNLG